MTKIKICGITNPEDAKYAVLFGVDYCGLIFAPSPRQIIKETALRIIKETPNFSNYVGVFLNQKKKFIEEICSYANIKIVQLHGDETPAFCNYFIKRGYDVIKVFRVKDKQTLSEIKRYNKVNLILFDTYSDIQYGGTGNVFDWSILKDSMELKNKKIIVSGGVCSENVKKLIDMVNPYAVDASSKLESETGNKDKTKVKEFIEIVKEYKK